LTCKSIPFHPREMLMCKVLPISELPFPIYASFLENRSSNDSFQGGRARL
jgi:hypothetical protein